MASGFSDGGPEFYGGGGRSMAGGNLNPSSQQQQQPTLYRTTQQQHQQQQQQQLPRIFLDQTTGQIASRAMPGLISGKRNLSDFQNSAALNAFLLRSVKPRTFQNLPSPISPLPPSQMDLSAVRARNDIQLFGSSSQQRYGLPMRAQHVGMGTGIGFGSVNAGITVQNRVQPLPQDNSEKMMNRLKELEKHLLDDDFNDEDADAVSVITNNTNSEWSSETIQSLMTPNPNPNPVLLSSSPTSSSSSSSSSSAASSPVSLCSKQTIMDVATAISEGRIEAAAEILARVPLTGSNGKPNNSEQKVVEFMLSALRSRINPAENPPPVAELYGKEHSGSTQLLYELSPCFKLGFMAANEAILDAVGNEDGFHVVDLDIGQGGQYVNLLHALSLRNKAQPCTLKITAVTDKNESGDERLLKVKSLLGQLAERSGVRFEFNISAVRLAELTRDSLGCQPDEPLAVTLAFKLFSVPDESVCTENPRDDLLRRVKGLNPRVVTLVEQEINGNTAPFLSRVAESCSYYGALLDSVESTVPGSNADRAKVEEGVRRKMANTVACEGVERVERCEVFGKWRVRMSMAGFELMPVSRAVAESMKLRLGNGNRVHPGFTVKEDNGGVCFGWMGRTLTVASAWL